MGRSLFTGRLEVQHAGVWGTVCYVESSRPEASANSPSSTPRQRQIKRREAPSLGQPRPASANHSRLVCAGRPYRPWFRQGRARR